jgi:hypothetical protein
MKTRNRIVRWMATAAALTLVANPSSAQMGRGTMDRAAMRGGDVRVLLNGLFAEHIWLAGAATGAALQGSAQGFGAAAAALDSNSVAIAGAVGAVHGANARDAFLPLWRRHIGFVVDYTQGVAAKDRGKQDRAVKALLGYADDLAAFLHSAHPRLPMATLAELIRGHIVTLKAVIDAQAAGKWDVAFLALRGAAAHMQMIADPLAMDVASRPAGDR